MMAAKRLDGAVDRTNDEVVAARDDELPTPKAGDTASQRVECTISGVHPSIGGAPQRPTSAHEPLGDEHVQTAMQLLTWLEQHLSAPPSGHAGDEARERTRMLLVLDEARASLSEHARLFAAQQEKK